jgi:antitoxin VapB
MGIYHNMVDNMKKRGIGKVFRNGRSQAVRLPQEFRFSGDQVRIRRVGRGILLEPLITNAQDWFALLDTFAAEPFMPERNQPATPVRDGFE